MSECRCFQKFQNTKYYHESQKIVRIDEKEVKLVIGYDPEDAEISSVLPPNGTFEAFYAKDTGTGSARPAHSHGSFFKYRNPALVDTTNAAAYGYRFDGKRRFNYK